MGNSSQRAAQQPQPSALLWQSAPLTIHCLPRTMAARGSDSWRHPNLPPGCPHADSMHAHLHCSTLLCHLPRPGSRVQTDRQTADGSVTWLRGYNEPRVFLNISLS